jgi:hypothetical protein
LYAQRGLPLKIQPAVWNALNAAATPVDRPFLSVCDEQSHPFYAAAKTYVLFVKALKNRRLPARRPASYYLGQFPDTLGWQWAEKQQMYAAVAALKHEGSAGPGIVYVRKGGRGNGSSWRYAFGDLQAALAGVKPGQQVWVAAGTYFPTEGADRDASFVIPDSVRLYGGFAGYETDLYQRQWDKHLTILSGEIGEPGPEDNAYTVVYTELVGAHTLVDGFVITGGYADGVQHLGDPQRCGGGWYNDGAGGQSSPTIANCLFVHNYARDGAGFYSSANNGEANPTFLDCQFVNNRADLDGGGLFIDSREGKSKVQIEHCYFTDNRSNFGSGISNRSESGQTMLILERCVFEANTSYVRKVIHNASEMEQGAEVNFLKIERACRFADNISVVGEDENTTTASGGGSGKKLKPGEIAYLAF